MEDSYSLPHRRERIVGASGASLHLAHAFDAGFVGQAIPAGLTGDVLGTPGFASRAIVVGVRVVVRARDGAASEAENGQACQNSFVHLSSS